MKLCIKSLYLPCLLLSSVSLVGCSFFWRDSNPDYGPTIADLKNEVVIPDDPSPVPKVPINQIEESYRAALDVAKDSDIRHRILIRLADLEMARSENRQLTASESGEYFKGAVDMYSELLKLNSERQGETGTPTNERLLYQLSKAYALDGNIEDSNAALDKLVTNFPESAFAAEAEFRRAEQAFSNSEYEKAEQLYAQVMAAGDDTPFYGNAVYMHGWSQFKRGRYRASVKSFTEVLDRTVIEGKTFNELSNSQKSLATDTLRIISIVFSYLDGAETITEIYSILGERHYQYLLYMNLGDLYLEKKRFRDSADTYRHYVKFFSHTDYAPLFSVKAIEVYNQGNFPSLILPAKDEYVKNYGAYSQYWTSRGENQRASLKPYLSLYLEELSSYYHAEALGLQKANVDYDKKRAAGKRPKTKPEPAVPVFFKAAKYYKEFVFTFPKDKKTPEMAYLMGEAYYEAGDLIQAVKAYEAVAYNYLDKKRGPDAGYAAIVSLQSLMDKAADAEKAAWQTQKINSAISFADYYPNDKRAAPVLTKAAQELFEQGEMQRALKIATRMTVWQPTPDKSLRKTAWLILAHSQFDLKQYTDAEQAYRKVLTLINEKDPDHKQVVERIAASIYRQSETQIASGDKLGAIKHLLSLRNIAPGSDIAVSGQYDAANYMIELKDWKGAEAALLDFKKRYPKDKLTATLPPKFALIYQESKQWGKAAQVLSGMSKSEADPEVRRQSLYLAAELFERAGDKDQAIIQYRNYEKKYPIPFDLATEARFHLVELYKKTKQSGKEYYWLKQLVEKDAKAGNKRSERSKYLAAFASAKFADDDYSKFSRIKITLPLKKSLKKKKSALNKTLASYKKVMDYGIAEFTTQANSRIGQIYGQLSKDLMNSQRPKGLDALALEQYEILLEEQAFPFEEKSIDIHSANAQRAWTGIYDKWVKESFKALAELLPARYGKKEAAVEVSDGIY